MSRTARLLTVSAACLTATVAVAQDAVVDWDMTQDRERKLIAASTSFSSGISIALRCMDGQYDALIAGLPAVDPGVETRALSLQFGDETPDERPWYVATDPTIAVSNLPARLARQLRRGGQVRLRLQEPEPEGRRIRHDLDLPTSATNIDQTLTACDRPTQDPRDDLLQAASDDGLPPELGWAAQPRPQYPSGRTFTRGFVTLSCLSRPDGRLGDCVVESEFPLGGGFAQAALSGTRRARLENRADPGSPLPVRLIVYTTNFSMHGGVDISASSRLPRQ